MPISKSPLEQQHDDDSASAGPMATGRFAVGPQETDPGIAAKFAKYIDHPLVFHWKVDTFVFAPFNHGNLDASKFHKGFGGDLYVFVPGNMGNVLAEDHDVKSVKDIDKGWFNEHASAKVNLDSDVFIYAPNNKGTIHGASSADASAYAEAVSKFGHAKAEADAKADAHVLIYNPNNTGHVSADVAADAKAQALADGYKSAMTEADAYAHTSAEITADPSVLNQFKVISMMGGYGHLLNAWA